MQHQAVIVDRMLRVTSVEGYLLLNSAVEIGLAQRIPAARSRVVRQEARGGPHASGFAEQVVVILRLGVAECGGDALGVGDQKAAQKIQPARGGMRGRLENTGGKPCRHQAQSHLLCRGPVRSGIGRIVGGELFQSFPEGLWVAFVTKPRVSARQQDRPAEAGGFPHRLDVAIRCFRDGDAPMPQLGRRAKLDGAQSAAKAAEISGQYFIGFGLQVITANALDGRQRFARWLAPGEG